MRDYQNSLRINREWKARNRAKLREYERDYHIGYKESRRKYNLKVKYKISIDEYEAMLVKQNNVCAICKTTENYIDNRTGINRRFAVDHCHTTGKIRGLLCGKCNKGIGLFNDNPSLLEQVINYLKGN